MSVRENYESFVIYPLKCLGGSESLCLCVLRPVPKLQQVVVVVVKKNEDKDGEKIYRSIKKRRKKSKEVQRKNRQQHSYWI